MDPDINVANLSAAKITVTDFSTTANITTAKLGVTGDVFCNSLVVSGNLNLIQQDLGVSGSVSIGQDLEVQGNEVVWGNLGVTGTLGVGSILTANNDLVVKGNETVWGNLGVTGTLEVDGTVTANGDLVVHSNQTVWGTLGVTGTLEVDGTVTANNDLVVKGNETVWGTLGVTGTLEVEGTVTANNDLVVQGNEVVWGTLGVTGTLEVEGTVTANGDLVVQGNEVVWGTLGVTGYTDSLVSHVPTSVIDSALKLSLASGVLSQTNTLSPGQTGTEFVLPNFAIVSGNAFTGEEYYQSAGITESGGTAAPTQEEYHRMASMGKCVAGLIAAKAFEERIVDIDDPVYMYLGETGSSGSPGGNGWWAKENCQVLTWTPDPLGTDNQYDMMAYGIGAGATGTWGLTGCEYDMTLRNCLQMTVGLPYQFFNCGAAFLSQPAYNPKVNRTLFNYGYNTTGVTGTYRYSADSVILNPEFSQGVTGFIALGGTGAILDYEYENMRNTLWAYTLGDQGPSGITGTLLTNQPGSVCEYGQGNDLFCIALHKAIQQKNTTAFGYYSVAASLSFTGATAEALIGLASDTAVFSKASMALGITTLTVALAGAYLGAGGGGAGIAAMLGVFVTLIINDVIDYMNDRILVPIGATSLFFGGGQSVIPGDFSGNIIDASNIGWTGFGSDPGNTATFLQPLGDATLVWDSDPTAELYLIDAAQVLGAGVGAALGYTPFVDLQWFAVVQSFTWSLARVKQYDYAVVEPAYNSNLQYKGWVGTTLLGKLTDFAKLLKLMAQKGTWNGQRIIGKGAMDFILNGSVPTSKKMQIYDPVFDSAWDPFATYQPPTQAISPYNISADDKTWAYGFCVGDELNVDNNQRMMKFPGSSKLALWNGAFGTFWIVDWESGVYAVGGTQQFAFSDYNSAVKVRVPYVAPSVIGAGQDPNLQFLNYFSGFKPLGV
jgi:CubicO group peptidase (beta-lactamase class C family)/cytoskeletal protein CcmA (bactofilin family)